MLTGGISQNATYQPTVGDLAALQNQLQQNGSLPGSFGGYNHVIADSNMLANIPQGSTPQTMDPNIQLSSLSGRGILNQLQSGVGLGTPTQMTVGLGNPGGTMVGPIGGPTLYGGVNGTSTGGGGAGSVVAPHTSGTGAVANANANASTGQIGIKLNNEFNPTINFPKPTLADKAMPFLQMMMGGNGGFQPPNPGSESFPGFMPQPNLPAIAQGPPGASIPHMGMVGQIEPPRVAPMMGGGGGGYGGGNAPLQGGVSAQGGGGGGAGGPSPMYPRLMPTGAPANTGGPTGAGMGMAGPPGMGGMMAGGPPMGAMFGARPSMGQLAMRPGSGATAYAGAGKREMPRLAPNPLSGQPSEVSPPTGAEEASAGEPGKPIADSGWVEPNDVDLLRGKGQAVNPYLQPNNAELHKQAPHYTGESAQQGDARSQLQGIIDHGQNEIDRLEGLRDQLQAQKDDPNRPTVNPQQVAAEAQAFARGALSPRQQAILQSGGQNMAMPRPSLGGYLRARNPAYAYQAEIQAANMRDEYNQAAATYRDAYNQYIGHVYSDADKHLDAQIKSTEQAIAHQDRNINNAVRGLTTLSNSEARGEQTALNRVEKGREFDAGEGRKWTQGNARIATGQANAATAARRADTGQVNAATGQGRLAETQQYHQTRAGEWDANQQRLQQNQDETLPLRQRDTASREKIAYGDNAPNIGSGGRTLVGDAQLGRVAQRFGWNGKGKPPQAIIDKAEAFLNDLGMTGHK